MKTVIESDRVWAGGTVHDGWTVTISAGTILRVGPPARHQDVTVRLPGRLLVPGLVNAHSHAFQRAFRGQVQRTADGQDDFWSWRTAMYGVAGTLPPEGVHAVSRLAFLEMAEAGITRVGEFHYLHHAPDGTPYADPEELARRVIAAALDVGIRITLLRVVYGRNGPGEPLAGAQLRFADRGPEDALAALDRLGDLAGDRVGLGLAPHSVRAVPGVWLRDLAGFAGVVHAHVAEQPREVAICRAEHGRSPLQVLAAAGLVSERFTAVHLTWPDEGDLTRLRDAGGRVCACPSTELDLGDGFLPLAAREVPLCVGSDSQARIDLLGEVRALEWHGRAVAGRRNVMSPPGERHGLAARLLDIATRGGARALGVPVPDAAGLAAGRPADLVALDLERPAAAGVPPLEAVVFGGGPEWVTDVWVAGERVVADGRHPRREEVARAAAPWLSGVAGEPARG